jgi:cathepsin D
MIVALLVNGEPVDIGSTSRSRAAIDTGTTLIGGPPAVIAEIFSKIPGSQPGTGDFDGYYTYPCDTQVNVSMAFGDGTLWSINPEDFLLTQLTSTRCLGAFFQLDMGNNGPSWIVGDTFLVIFLLKSQRSSLIPCAEERIFRVPSKPAEYWFCKVIRCCS